MSVGASSIKRAAKSAAKPEEKNVKAIADETEKTGKPDSVKTGAEGMTTTSSKKKPGRPAKKTAEKSVKAEKVVKQAAQKKPATPEMYGIGDKLPIHLM